LKLLKENLNRVKFLNNSKIWFIIILAFFAMWSFPKASVPAEGGLDPSWRMALHMAKLNDLIWGTEVVGTYGPLGYLIRPQTIDQTLWSHTFLYTIVSHTLFFLIAGIFIFRTKHQFLSLIAFGVISVLLIGFARLYFPIVGIMLAYYLYLEYSRRYVLLLPLSFVTAFLFFTKGDLAVGSLSILSLSCIILLTRRRWKEIAISVSSYLFFIFLIWSAMRYPLEALGIYFTNSIMIISGYATAMSRDNVPYVIYLAAFAWFLYFWWVLDSAKKEKKDLTVFFISAGILFIMFKLGIV